MRHIFIFFALFSSTLAISQTKTDAYFVSHSSYSFEETLSELKKLVSEKGMTIFAEIDHSKAAKDAGLSLEPTTVLIVGNPKAGTNLMKDNQAAAIHLPLKLLITEKDKKVNITYQKIEFLAKEYNLKKHLSTLRAIDDNIIGLLKKHFHSK